MIMNKVGLIGTTEILVLQKKAMHGKSFMSSYYSMQFRPAVEGKRERER